MPRIGRPFLRPPALGRRTLGRPALGLPAPLPAHLRRTRRKTGGKRIDMTTTSTTELGVKKNSKKKENNKPGTGEQTRRTATRKEKRG